ncbi:uncharacterized protein LAJ45_03135 [Morchella importuna]|uniref:uncharacterized protein n=1 Tax=Morchella importuna TaxID=1174673 RepID=UPI001E8CE2A6|nr:uncharacterized protein LAJ45_03135 [Morchella importuna]KAH8152909.1 hypothetical protein LAJ45_03135 [Morchella importuna]
MDGGVVDSPSSTSQRAIEQPCRSTHSPGSPPPPRPLPRQRRQQQHLRRLPPTSHPPHPRDPSATTTPAAAPRLTETRRQLKQLTFLLSGSTFLALSILTTRRTLAKRRLALIPPFYHPNNRPPLVPPNGALDAFQALNLATLNTMAFAIFLVGGSMVALDVCSVDELRERARKSVVGEEELAKEREAEEEFEEWLASVLARKERKEEIRRRVKEDMEREKAGEGV